MNSLTPQYEQADRDTLLNVAKQSIQHGIESGTPLKIDSTRYNTSLQEKRAVFVTLKINNELRGCIGSLLATQALINDVASNAFSAAFRDPRFPPLTATEFEKTTLSISVLSPPEPVEFTSEQDLLKKIRPGVGGLVLTDSHHRGTFLPAVWESLPEPEQFLQQLKLKAGLPGNYWSDTIRIERYTAESIE